MSAFKHAPPAIVVEEPRSNTTGTDKKPSLTVRSPRSARFAENTTFMSPIEPPKTISFGTVEEITPIESCSPEPQVADFPVGGYGTPRDSIIQTTTVEVPLTPGHNGVLPSARSLKVPGTPGKFLDPRSPTFKQELALEKEEQVSEKQNAKDLRVKVRVRVAKFFLRGTNFSCSLIVLSMLSTSFSIFNTTKTLPARNNLPAWASNTQAWPQITLLVISCVSLVISVFIFWGYYKGGHNKATKTSKYYTYYAIGFFLFSTAMWLTGAVVIHQSRANGQGQDMWGWSCNNNKRATLFDDTVDYALVCRLQNWSLICALIEIVVEVITISIYLIGFYRVRSKRRLHKAMDKRDQARSDLYLAQLKLQSAPNTPGFGLKSGTVPTFGAHVHGPELEKGGYMASVAEEGESYEDMEYAKRHQQTFGQAVPMGMPVPGISVTGATPQVGQGEWVQPMGPSAVQDVVGGGVHEHFDAAPGEQVYESVPIPGMYGNTQVEQQAAHQHY